MKNIITILLLAACLFSFSGCESDAQTGALIGGAAGAGIGQAAGGNTESTLIGGAIGAGGGYLLGRHSDKKKEEEAKEDALQDNSETIWITNSNGSQTPVTITRQGDKYIGPKGEIYNSRPTEEQLKEVYGF
jgi:uncharacterized protein YcfJ